MIQSNELRVGNWVEVNGKVIKVESIDNEGVNCEVTGGYYAGETERDYAGHFKNNWFISGGGIITPIELSPEILEKCGFRKFSHEPGYTLGGDDKKSERCDEYSIGKLSIMDWGNGFILSNSFSFELRIELKSLHQLQNLYFSLCGEELNYTP